MGRGQSTLLLLERFQDRYTLSALLRGRRSLGSRRLECIPFGYGNPETAIAVAPANSNWWATFTQSSRRTVLLKLKLIEMHDAKAIYQINANELHGFQFGNPAVAPYEVWLVLFDRNDRRYEISLHRKENNAPFVSQAEVNAIVASIRPVPHS